MKLYAPKYYKDFVCTADKCSHSCCVGWEIDVDGETLKKYRSLSNEYGKKIMSSIDTKDTPHFRLAENDRCPHLNGKGLCEIILNLGEEYLCDICREHPRFYNDTKSGKEAGLGMACEEACRIILDSDDYGILVEVGETDGEAVGGTFDARVHREDIYKILSDVSLSYNRKLQRIYNEYNVSPSILSDGEWKDILLSLEYLDEEHKELFSEYSSESWGFAEPEKALERALAYFIFRHCTETRDEDEFRIALGFCLFCERLLASLARGENIKDTKGMITLARILSEEIEYSEDNTDRIKLEFSFL